MYHESMKTATAREGPVKVLCIITKSNFGGAQRYVYDIVTQLPKDQFDVVVAFGGTGNAGSEQGALARMLDDAHIRTVYIPELTRDISLVSDWRTLWALVALMRKERPHVVHLNSTKVGGLGSLAGRIARVPRIIYTAHGWAFWEKRNPIALFIIRILSWMTVAFSHTTICISEFDRVNIGWMLGVQRKIAVIHNGIAPFPLIKRVSARNHLFTPNIQHVHDADFWLISIGELHPNKNYFMAIDSVAAYNHSHTRKIFYSIMSNGELRDSIEQYIIKHQIQDMVQLLGFVNEGKQYLEAFDALYLPSKKEGLPYVLLEAGFAKVPVVASAVGGIPELVVENETGLLVDPESVESSVSALQTLIADADLRTRISKQLYVRVSSDYSIDSMVQQVVRLYHLYHT